MRLLISLLLSALGVNAASLDDLGYTTAGGKVTITDCDETPAGELVIPNTIGGNPVTSIKGSTFWGCASLTNITIPDGVTSIGAAAFLRCSSLTSITIPDSVTSIEGSAFAYCSSLTSITIPDSVTSIGDNAFYKCSSLTSITIPDNVTVIGSNAFRDCTSLTSITIPDRVTTIGEYAFADCTSLTSISMEGPPPSVGSAAFLGPQSRNALVKVKPEYRANYGEAGDRWNLLIITETEEECDNEELATLVALLAQKDAQIAELERRPTQNQYEQVVAELDARPSLEDIQEARAGSVVLTPTGNGTVILRMMIEESSDLSVWENSEESVEVELPLAEGKKFLRFALK